MQAKQTTLLADGVTGPTNKMVSKILLNQGFLGHGKANIEFYHPIGKQVAGNRKTG